MTAADPRRDRLNRIASACPQRAVHKPQRSEAASANELHTAIAAAEDVVDPRSAGSDFQPDPVPQGVMESIAAMGAEQDRRNAAVARVTTPGSWHCDGSTYQSTGTKVYKQWGNAGNQQLIADCDPDNLNNPECFANARLIAAAPDLLAACKLAWIALGLGRTLPIGVPVELHDALRDAITKATGGAK